MDFKLSTYRNLLKSIQKAGYKFYTFVEHCEGKSQGRYVILRHDVDLKPHNSLVIAQIEAELGIRSTYFFRTSNAILKAKIINRIQQMGHEIGYHYRDLVDASGNMNRAIELFQLNLEKLRSVANVKTIAMDGCPWSKYDNRDIWKFHNYSDFGIIGEPYFDFINSEILYFTDTARMWDGDKYNVRDKRADEQNKNKLKIHSTTDLINWFETTPTQNMIMITTHPQRWTDNKVEWFVELVLQKIKNEIKKNFIKRK